MSRTELDAATLAKALRRMAGDGSVEWVTGPIQASVLLDVADLMDDNAKLRELLSEIAKLVTNPYGGCLRPGCANGCPHHLECDEELYTCFYVDRMRELGIEVNE